MECKRNASFKWNTSGHIVYPSHELSMFAQNLIDSGFTEG